MVIADINANDFLLHYGKETYKKRFLGKVTKLLFRERFKILLKQFNLQHIKTKFLQRYDYENNKNYIIKIILLRRYQVKLTQNILNIITKTI